MLTWGLQHVAHRPGGNLPGKVAMKIDPQLVSELRDKIFGKSIVVVGTNGKTTVTNMLADCVVASGRSVLCNRTGANLKSGITSALLQAKPSDCGVIECDELWLHRVTPDLKPTYVLLLNLFRDQLDRCGEIDRIQESIADALKSSPDTTLVFNADDPLCAHVAELVDNRTISFGFDTQMNLAQNLVSDASICERCSHMLEYEYRQYAQLGNYHCTNCSFARPALDFIGTEVELKDDGVDISVASTLSDEWTGKISSELAGSYMAYNLLAVFSGAMMMDCTPADVQKAVSAFDPHNGRLQRLTIDNRDILLNLAKNPTGFNQNLRIVEKCETPCAVAFFINDQVVDGHDISWIWDIDFEEIASRDDVIVFAGGRRKNDLQVRLKYAGVDAKLIDQAPEVLQDQGVLAADEAFGKSIPFYAIANYSALPPVKQKLESLANKAVGNSDHTQSSNEGDAA